MAAIFPPASQGGVPPGPGVVNGFTPTHHVIGEGPLYVAPDCTTILTDGQLNALTSEILAAVDELGFPYNSSIVDNLGRALTDRFGRVNQSIATKVSKAGDTMTGPLVLPGPPLNDNEAATKAYVDQQDSTTNSGLRQYVDQRAQEVTTAFQAADAVLDENKVNRSGDVMTGALELPGDPTEPLQAATKQYVDGRTLLDAPDDGEVYARQNRLWVPISATLGNYLRLSGGTMTGPLVLHDQPTAPDEAATKQYVDSMVAAGGTYIEAPEDGYAYGRMNATWVQVLPLTGGTLTGNLQIAATDAMLTLNKSSTSGANAVRGQMNGVLRWQMLLGGGTPETGDNVGSDFHIQRFRDDGSPIDNPLVISRATGVVSLWDGLTAGGQIIADGAIITKDHFNSTSYTGVEIQGRLQAGVYEHIMFTRGYIPSADRFITLEGWHYPGNWAAGRIQAYTAQFDFRNDGSAQKPGGGQWVDLSDARIKNVVGDYEHGLAEIRQLQPKVYTYKGNDTQLAPAAKRAPYENSTHYDLAAHGTRCIGLIAQDAEGPMPELVRTQLGMIDGAEVDDLRLLDPSPLIFALINAVKTLADEVDALKAGQSRKKGAG